MKVLVGTASWSDKSLVASKKFYPADVITPEGRLRYYASRFPVVEVDTPFYAIPPSPRLLKHGRTARPRTSP